MGERDRHCARLGVGETEWGSGEAHCMKEGDYMPMIGFAMAHDTARLLEERNQ